MIAAFSLGEVSAECKEQCVCVFVCCGLSVGLQGNSLLWLLCNAFTNARFPSLAINYSMSNYPMQQVHAYIFFSCVLLFSSEKNGLVQCDGHSLSPASRGSGRAVITWFPWGGWGG